MAKELTVLCGGRSTEHDISLLSAQNVIRSCDPSQWRLTVVYICPAGHWYRLTSDSAWAALIAGSPDLSSTHFEPIAAQFNVPSRPWLSTQDPSKSYPCDLVFPVLHGYLGEDGCIQGVLSCLNLPFVGGDTTASAVCMHKVRTREVLEASGIAVVPYKTWSRHAGKAADYLDYFNRCSSHVFIKPLSSGSSVGVSEARTEEELLQGVKDAFSYDEWVVIEPAVVGREIEVAVLGNRECMAASNPSEIVTPNGFYSFDAKYNGEGNVSISIEADFSASQKEHIKQIACLSAQALDCEGMLRVDGFMTDSGFVINEVNTIPGFTAISLYPKMWEHTGLSTEALINRLLQLALLRSERDAELVRVPQVEGVS